MVVLAGGRRLLQDQDGQDNSWAQPGVEDVREDVCELLSSLSGHGQECPLDRGSSLVLTLEARPATDF